MVNQAFLEIHKAVEHIFMQLDEALQNLTADEYSKPVKILSGATIGQHVRHIAELFIELEKGYACGTVNYEKRKRDYSIETNKEVAIAVLQQIHCNLNRDNKALLLEGIYYEDGGTTLIPTNYYREVVYNLEHTVHHMALIRIGINDVSDTALPDSFGVASATIKYRKACAQ